MDIGAHHGLYAAAALHTYRASRIICVEPSADALGPLRANLTINRYEDRARVVAAALAPVAGQGFLQHTTDGTWGYSLYEDASATRGSEPVALATLEEILQGERPEIIKCNAEGAEFALIHQIRRSGVRPRLMVIMVHPQFGDVRALLDDATAAGYSFSQAGTAERPAFHMWHRRDDVSAS